MACVCGLIYGFGCSLRGNNLPPSCSSTLGFTHACTSVYDRSKETIVSFRPKMCRDGVVRGVLNKGPNSLSAGRKPETSTQNLLKYK